jgi:AraC-like DNA-binding protein
LRPPGFDRVTGVADWTRSVVARVAVSGPGRSVRSIERRLRRASGKSRRTLDFFGTFDRLHAISRAAPDRPLAEIALDAGYSDQSHMGRAVRRATGFSPARLNRAIETEEAFWCYRLLGERF